MINKSFRRHFKFSSENPWNGFRIDYFAIVQRFLEIKGH
jgi:hypothetical protein